jgi:hypothetical protein
LVPASYSNELLNKTYGPHGTGLGLVSYAERKLNYQTTWTQWLKAPSPALGGAYFATLQNVRRKQLIGIDPRTVTVDGARVEIQPDHNLRQQQWLIVPMVGQRAFIIVNAGRGKCLDVKFNTPKHFVGQFYCHGQSNQQ